MDGFFVLAFRKLVKMKMFRYLLKLIWFLGFFAVFFGPYMPVPNNHSLSLYSFIIFLNLLFVIVMLLFHSFRVVPLRSNKYFIFLFIWFFWSLLSYTWALNKASAGYTNEFLFLQTNCIFFTALYMECKEKFIQWILTGMAAVFVIYTIVGIWEIVTMQHLSQSAALFYKLSIKRSPTAFFHNPNDFSAVIATYLPFVIGAFVFKKKLVSWLSLGAIVGCLVLVVQAKSRGGFLAVLIGALVWALLTGLASWKQKLSIAQIRKSILVVGMILLLLLFFSNGSMMKLVHRVLPEDFFNMDQDLHAISPQLETNSSGNREILIYYGFRILNKRPLIGVGVGNTETYMTPWKEQTGGMTNMHNWWIELLVNYGYPFGILFILFYLGLIWELLKIFWREKSQGTLIPAMIAMSSLSSFFLSSISPSSIKNFNAIWSTFGIALGVVFHYYKKERIDRMEAIRASASTVIAPKLRILVISDLYPNQMNQHRGCFVRDQLVELAKEGVDIRVISPIPTVPPLFRYLSAKWRGYAQIPETACRDGILIYYPRYINLPGGVFFQSAGRCFLWAIVPVVRELWQQGFHFDLIHSHVAFPDGFAGWKLARSYKRPHIVTIHGQDLTTTIHKNQKCRKVVQEVLVHADKVLVVSQQLKKMADELLQTVSIKKESSHVQVLHNGYAPMKVVSEQRAFPHLVSVGHLIPIKGHDDTIRAAALLVAEFPDLSLTIVGDGPEMSTLKALAASLQMKDRVTFTGRKSPEETRSIIQAGDMFVLPSWREGFGIVYLEAMSEGKVVVGCTGQGIEDVIIHRENGLLVPPQSPEVLAEELRYILREHGLFEIMGQKARDLIGVQYTWEKKAREIRTIYDEILQRNI